MKSTHVRMDGRYFVVDYAPDGSVRQIKERKAKQKPAYGVYNEAFWHVKHHTANPGTIPARVIEAAKVKRDAAS